MRRILRWLAIAAFTFFLFFFFVYLLFPYERLFQRLTHQIQHQAKVKLAMKYISPYWVTGIQTEKLNVQKQVKKGTAEVQIDRLTARISVLPLLILRAHIHADIDVARGQIQANATYKSNTVETELALNNIVLGALGPPLSAVNRRDKDDPPRPLLAMLFAPVYGKVNGDVKLTIPLPSNAAPLKSTKKKKRRRRYRRRNPNAIDLQKLKGRVKLKIRGFSVGPGYFPTAQMGELPVPLLKLGSLNLELRIAKGKIRFVKATSVGQDGELYVKGTIHLKPRLIYSSFRGEIRFKIAKSFLDRLNTPELGLLKGGVNMLGPGRNGYHRYKVYLPFRGRPHFTKM